MLYLYKSGDEFMELDIKGKNGLKTVVAYLIIFNIISTFVSILIIYGCKAINVDINSNYYFISSMINLIVYLILFAALWIINKNDLICDFKTFVKSDTRKNLILKVLAGYGIFYAINLLGNNLIANIEFYANFANNVLGRHTAITSTAENQTSIVSILSGKGFITMFLAAGIVGPICEEIVFRKAFFDLFKKQELALIFSSLFFAMIHIVSSLGNFNFLSIFLMTMPYLFSGVAFGVMYIKNDRNLMVPTIVHMLSNIVSMIAILAIS